MKMDVTIILGIILLGLLAGYLSGLVGIGGGIVMVPVLVLLFGFTQHKAQGTTLALLMIPVGIFGVMNYYKTVKGYYKIFEYRYTSSLCPNEVKMDEYQ